MARTAFDKLGDKLWRCYTQRPHLGAVAFRQYLWQLLQHKCNVQHVTAWLQTLRTSLATADILHSHYETALTEALDHDPTMTSQDLVTLLKEDFNIKTTVPIIDAWIKQYLYDEATPILKRGDLEKYRPARTKIDFGNLQGTCLLYTSPSPRDA